MNNSYNKRTFFLQIKEDGIRKAFQERPPRYAVYDWKLIRERLNATESCKRFQSEAETQVSIYVLVPPNG